MSYTRETWVELASTDPSSTPITAIRLNNIEFGIENSHARNLVTTARDLLVSSDGNLFTGRIIWNDTLGILQVYNGTTWAGGSAGGENPAAVTKSATTEGTSILIARADHKHDIATTTPSNIGTTNVEGTGSDLARADHIHAHPSGLGADLHQARLHLLGSTADHTADSLADISALISDGSIVLATSDEAVAGSNAIVRMTPLGVRQAIEATVNVQVAVKAADESVVSSTALQNDDHLTIPVLANKNYSFLLTLDATIDQIAGILIGWSVPTSATMSWEAFADMITASQLARMEEGDTHAQVVASDRRVLFAVTGVLRVQGTAGSLQMQWAQQTSDTDAGTLHEGSTLILWH